MEEPGAAAVGRIEGPIVATSFCNRQSYHRCAIMILCPNLLAQWLIASTPIQRF